MTSTAKIPVVVYDAPPAQAGGCACGCGGHHHGGEDAAPLEPSMDFQTRALAMTLELAFPGRVEVEYIDVLKDPRGPALPQTVLLCSLTYPTPLVYIDGRGRFAGALPVERIREEVGKILESRAG